MPDISSVSPQDWAALDALLAEVNSAGQTLDFFHKKLRVLAADRGWGAWLPLADKAAFAHWTRVIYRADLSRSYGRMRQDQLAKGGYSFWVYRRGGSLDCPAEHDALDGLALPPDHPFWARYTPPNAWDCACRVSGTRTVAGIRRLGGDPDKRLPDWWNSTDPATGLPPGIAPHYVGIDWPDTAWIVGQLAAGAL